MNRRNLLLGASALVGVTSAMRPYCAAAQTPRVDLGIAVDSTNYLPAMVAAALGYFKEEGANVELSIVGGGSNLRQVIASGQMKYAVGDVSHPLAMTASGKPSKVLLAIDTRSSVANIMVSNELWNKGIRTPEDIGKLKKPDGSKPQIAVTRVGAATWLYGTFIMNKLGLLDNVNFVAIPDGAPQIGALRSGRVDALVVNPIAYFTILDDKIGHAAFDTTDKAAWDRLFGSNVASQSLFALGSQIQTEPRLTQTIVDAMYRGAQYIKKNSPEKLQSVIDGKYLVNVKPETILREIDYFKKVFDYDGVVSQQSYANGRDIWFNDNTKISPQPYDQAFDFGFLMKAKQRLG